MLLLSLKQNWQAIATVSSVVISVLAFALSYKKFRHDTRPALIMRRISQGEGQWWDAIEIENVGQSVAVGVSLTLVASAVTSKPANGGHLKTGQ